MKNTCTAIASEGGQIHFVIKKGEKGYAAFSKILTDINQQKGALTWYGDIEDENGKEQSGLKIAASDSTQKEMFSIINNKINQISSEMRDLYNAGITIDNQKCSKNELYNTEITIFANQDDEDSRRNLIHTMFHLTKVKENICEYFKTGETLPKYNKL